MRALTLKQPWATIVALGLKPVENRSWKLPDALMGEDFAIHAGLTTDVEGAQWILKHFADDKVVCDLVRGHQHHGAVLGIAKLAGYLHGGKFFYRFGNEIRVKDDHPLLHNKWFFGKYGFVLEDVRTCMHPVPARGMQMFWHLPPEVEDKVKEEIPT